MDQRLDFVHDAQSNRFTMVELCARYGVSRRIGYKWLARFADDGRRGLADRSRRPHTCPTAVRSPLAELLCEFRRLHPDWGARKLLRVLRGRHPENRGLARREHHRGAAGAPRPRPTPSAPSAASASGRRTHRHERAE